MLIAKKIGPPPARPSRPRFGRKIPTRPPASLTAIDPGRPGDSIGAKYGTLLQAAKMVQAGLPFRAVARFQATSGLTLDRIKEAARISEGSFFRRKKSGKLSPEESERLMRLGRVFEQAVALHNGDQDAAREWLETPISALGDQRPLDLAQTDPGVRETEDLIGRISNGIVS